MASKFITGSLNSAAPGTAIQLVGRFNVLISGTFVATVKIEKSYDGSNWHVVSRDAAGAEASFTAPAQVTLDECETGPQYRVICTSYTSGTINYRLSQ